MKTQFTLRQMFVATAYVAVARALGTFVIQTYRTWTPASNPILGVLAFFGQFGMTALVGAAIGELLGDAKNGAKNGAVAGVPLYAASILVGALFWAFSL